MVYSHITKITLFLKGNPINAHDAYQAGLISRLVKTSEDLESEINSICEAISSKPRAVIALGKTFYYKQMEMGLSEAFEHGGKVMVDNLEYRDCQEGIAAFIEKRKPTWSHTDSKM